MKYRLAVYSRARRVRVLHGASTLRDARQALTQAPAGARIEIYLDGKWEPYE